MAVYVDEIREYPKDAIKGSAKCWGQRWSHMWTDGPVEELHAMAAKVGLRRSWFQDKLRHQHYDLVPSKRALAVKYGAVEISYAEWYKKNKRSVLNG